MILGQRPTHWDPTPARRLARRRTTLYSNISPLCSQATFQALAIRGLHFYHQSLGSHNLYYKEKEGEGRKLESSGWGTSLAMGWAWLLLDGPLACCRVLHRFASIFFVCMEEGWVWLMPRQRKIFGCNVDQEFGWLEFE